MFRWKWKAATAAGVLVSCIDVAVTPATYTCPIVPRGLRRGVLELRHANMIMMTVIMSQGSGIAHRRGAGAGPAGAGVIARRLSVTGRSGCRYVLDWP
jgi:hypothetical protein